MSQALNPRNTRRYIRRPEVLHKTGLSATTIYNLEQAGAFPRHCLITPRCAAWLESDIDAWLDSRATANVQPAPAPDVKKRRTALGKQRQKGAAA